MKAQTRDLRVEVILQLWSKNKTSHFNPRLPTHYIILHHQRRLFFFFFKPQALCVPPAKCLAGVPHFSSIGQANK